MTINESQFHRGSVEAHLMVVINSLNTVCQWGFALTDLRCIPCNYQLPTLRGGKKLP